MGRLPPEPGRQRAPLLPEHLAYFISDVVEQLDLSAITVRCQGEERGGPPYHPRMMVKVLLYGYCTGVASSRRIAQRLHEDIAFRVLVANNTPVSAPSPTSARIICKPWPTSSGRCWSFAGGPGW